MIEIIKMKLANLTQHPKNVRIHTKRNLEAIKNSLTKFGLYKPIIVQKSTGYVIAGNGTLQAANALGWDEIECNVLDLSDAEANALAIMDNRTGELSQWDEKNLVESLQKLRESSVLDFSGFDNMDLDRMLSFQGGDLFDKVSPQKEEKPAKQKAKPEDFPPKLDADGYPLENQPEKPEATPKKKETATYNEQICFMIDGYPFVLSDPEKISEMRCFISELKKSETFVQSQIVQEVYESMLEALAIRLE